MELSCFSCHKINQFSGKVGFRDECLGCHADLHSCKNCQFYDVKSYNQCRENSADVVREKDRANYCDYFTPRQGASHQGDEKARLKAAAEALFKK